MPYDPFARGPHPTGVTTRTYRDAARDRDLTVEVWYPATAEHAGRDLDPAQHDRFTPDGLSGDAGSLARQAAVRDVERLPGQHPLVLLCHGYSGHRRESTFMATHLASHGFVVASADFPGSTFPDIDRLVSDARAGGGRFRRADVMPALIEFRLGDIPFVLQSALDDFDCVRDRAGITGASFGGWSSFKAPDLDPRFRAIAPMCPSGGESPVYPTDKNYARNALDFNWRPGVAVLQMVADRDSWLPLYGQIELFRRAKGHPRRMVILAKADHNHFVDDIAYGHEWLREFTLGLADVESDDGTDWRAVANNIAPYASLTPEATAQLCWRGLCVAHMDAHLRGGTEARAFFAGDVIGELESRGIDAVEIRGGEA